MEERRKLQRKYLAFFTRVFDRRTGEMLGHLANVTTQGAMIISEAPVVTREEFRLRMDIPEEIFGKDHLDFEARTIWCQADINPRFFNTGFQFSNIAPQDIDIIERIIVEYGIRE